VYDESPGETRVSEGRTHFGICGIGTQLVAVLPHHEGSFMILACAGGPIAIMLTGKIITNMNRTKRGATKTIMFFP
jgi:hypothetical protein